MSWKGEHGASYEVPGFVEFLVKKGLLKDMSWHNDVSPSFGVADPKNEERGLRLWVDHPLRFLRETEGHRFLVQEGEFASTADFEEFYDELEDAVLAVLQRLAKYRPDIADLEDPDYYLRDLADEWRKR